MYELLQLWYKFIIKNIASNNVTSCIFQKMYGTSYVVEKLFWQNVKNQFLAEKLLTVIFIGSERRSYL